MQLAVAMVALAACATTGGSAPGHQPRVGVGDAFLTVANQHPHHVEISALPLHGSVMKVGSANIESHREFLLPRTLNHTQVRLVIRCLKTSEIFETRDIIWGPSDRFALTVANMLVLSNVIRSGR